MDTIVQPVCCRYGDLTVTQLVKFSLNSFNFFMKPKLSVISTLSLINRHSTLLSHFTVSSRAACTLLEHPWCRLSRSSVSHLSGK